MRSEPVRYDVVDEPTLARTAERLREARIALPTFAQLASPSLVPPSVPRRSPVSAPTTLTRSTCSASTGTTAPTGWVSSTCRSTSCCRES